MGLGEPGLSKPALSDLRHILALLSVAQPQLPASTSLELLKVYYFYVGGSADLPYLGRTRIISFPAKGVRKIDEPMSLYTTVQRFHPTHIMLRTPL